MRNLKSILKKLEDKLGYNKKVMVVFSISHHQAKEKEELIKEKLITEYKNTHPNENIGVCLFVTNYSQNCGGKFLYSCPMTK